MSPENAQDKDRILYENKILRREAGEGWHPDGLNNNLLGALVYREKLLNEIVEQSEKEEAPDWQEYEDQIKHISDLKEKFGITDPPVAPTEV